jgi:hypothetical protein
MAEIRTATTAKQIMDRYLPGRARRHGGRVITFDRAQPMDGTGVVCLLPDFREKVTSCSQRRARRTRWLNNSSASGLPLTSVNMASAVRCSS